MAILHEKKSVTVQPLAAEFNVTEETIRRDLKLLEGQGQLLRTHGGAVLSDEIGMETPLMLRESINIAGKNSIGKKAAAMVMNGDTIFLDASTSALYVARNIKDKIGLTVITNALRILMELADCEAITVFSTGGMLRNKSQSFVGRSAEEAIRSFYAGKVFFSCKGFSPAMGLADSNEQEASVKHAMLQRSAQAVFLCDHTKWGQAGYCVVDALEHIDTMITDQKLPPEWAADIQLAGVDVIVAE